MKGTHPGNAVREGSPALGHAPQRPEVPRGPPQDILGLESSVVEEGDLVVAICKEWAIGVVWRRGESHLLESSSLVMFRGTLSLVGALQEWSQLHLSPSWCSLRPHQRASSYTPPTALLSSLQNQDYLRFMRRRLKSLARFPCPLSLPPFLQAQLSCPLNPEV